MRRTLFELASNIADTRRSGKNMKNPIMISDGLDPEGPPLEEGRHLLSPNQLAGLYIDQADIRDKQKTGYQRRTNPTHVRRMAAALAEGDEFPTIVYAVHDGFGEVVEGQHRALAAMMAGVPIYGEARKMDMEKRKKFFTNQRKAAVLNREYTILSGHLPSEEYVTDAVTDPTGSNPWSKLTFTRAISKREQKHTNGSVPLATAHELIVSYVTKRHTHGAGHDEVLLRKYWNRHAADELAELVAVFGSKETNPLAFQSHALRGIAYAAIKIIRARDSKPRDIERWKKHMPLFDFTSYAHLRKSNQVRDAMIIHWNKRLREDHKVSLI